MASYKTVRNALHIHSVDVGLDDDAAHGAVQQSLQVPEYRAAIEAELEALIADPDAPWMDLVANDDYEIDEPDDEEDAREIVLELLWEDVFPGRPLPALE